MDPKNEAPLLKMPPSAATIQYPLRRRGHPDDGAFERACRRSTRENGAYP